MHTINRSCQSELTEGATDGAYRKVRPNTCVADMEGHAQTMANKASLPADYYGSIPLTQEWPSKVRPA